MDPKAISLLVRFPTIHKEHFEDILHNRFKPENILKLSTSFTTIKARVKYIKVGDSIELATHEDDSTAGEAKSITQLLRCFLLYGQIIIHFAPLTVQLELSIALAAYVDRLLGHSMVYTWETLRLFHFHFHRARIAMGVYDPLGWKTPNTDLETNCLMKKPMSYGNFAAPTSYFGNSTAGGNPYSSNHSYNPTSFQIGHTSRTGTGPQGFHTSLKQNDVAQPICRNFNNGKDCPPTCRYRHVCAHCAGPHPAKDCPSNAAASGSNSVPLRHR